MQNIIELRKLFDRLPIDNNNFDLYEKLLDLDQSIYKPIIFNILSGRIDIEDFREILSKTNILLGVTIGAFNLLFVRSRMTEAEFIKANIVARLFDRDSIVKESYFEYTNEIDYQREMVEAYLKEHPEVTISEEEMQNIITGLQSTSIHISYDDIEINREDLHSSLTASEIKKMKQLIFANLLTPKN